MFDSLIEMKYVDISSVSSSIPRSDFNPEDLDALAQIFLRSGGSTKPLILERVGNDAFNIVEGHFEFYAAQKAQEIDDDFEMIQSIILDKDNEKGIKEQIEFSGVEQKPPSNDNVNQLITNLDNRLSAKFNELQLQIENSFERIVPKSSLSLLEKFNDLETIKLKNELIKGGINLKVAEKKAELITAERKRAKFESLNDLIDRVREDSANKKRVITEATLVKLIDAWSQ